MGTGVEGAETKEEAEGASEKYYGCCFFQGYYYSKTFTEEDL